MSILFAVRVFADLCLYAGLAGCIGGVCDQTMALWLPAAICGLASGLACLLQERTAHRAAFLLSLPCLLLPHNLTDWILLAPMLLYTLLVTQGTRFSLEQDVYLGYFPKGLMALGLALLVSLLGLDSEQVLLYGALYAVCGVYLLRQLRLTNGSDWKDKLLNLLVLAGVICGGILSGWILRGTGAALTWLMSKLEGLFYAMRNLIGESEESKLPPPVVEEGPEVPLPDLNVPEFEQADIPVRHNMEHLVRQILTVVLLLAAVLAICLLIRRLVTSFSRGKGKKTQPVWTERLHREEYADRKAGATNRERIRKVYRKFLRLLRERGAVLHPYHTTADVHIQAAAFADREASEALRDLYRQARYDEGAEISAEQARKAKELMRKID